MHHPIPIISTACPRCGKATVWDRRGHGGGDTVAVRRAGCACWLSRDQWADLAELAEAALVERAP